METELSYDLLYACAMSMWSHYRDVETDKIWDRFEEEYPVYAKLINDNRGGEQDE